MTFDLYLKDILTRADIT